MCFLFEKKNLPEMENSVTEADCKRVRIRVLILSSVLFAFQGEVKKIFHLLASLGIQV